MMYTTLDRRSGEELVRVRVTERSTRFAEVYVSAPFQVRSAACDPQLADEGCFYVSCLPTGPNQEYGYLDIYWCDDTFCDEGGRVSVDLYCLAPILGPTDTFAAGFRNAATHATFALTNPLAEPVTITTLSSSDPAVLAVSASLPATIPPGGSLDVALDFTLTENRIISLDALEGTTVRGRVAVHLDLRRAIELGFPSPIPLGATYSGLLMIRNSELVTRTITGATIADADIVLPDLTGLMLAPGEEYTTLVLVTGQTLGQRSVTLTVSFDQLAAESRSVFVKVAPPTFALTTGDATPDDGWLDLGTVDAAGPSIQRTFSITNLGGSQMHLQCYPANATLLAVVDCPGVIDPGANATFTLQFTPRLGIATSSFIVDLGSSNQIVIPVRGVGEVQTYAAPADPIDFVVAPSTTATRIVTVTSSGPVELVLPVRIFANAGAFSGPTSVTIPAGGSADVEVVYNGIDDADGVLAIGHLMIPLHGRIEVPPPDGCRHLQCFLEPRVPLEVADPGPLSGGCSAGGTPGLMLALLALLRGASSSRSRRGRS